MEADLVILEMKHLLFWDILHWEGVADAAIYCSTTATLTAPHPHFPARVLDDRFCLLLSVSMRTWLPFSLRQLP